MTKAALHFKPTAMTVDGAACGKRGVDFTGRPSLVTCKACLRVMPAPTVTKSTGSRRRRGS